ncbi:hypothetical protein BHE74_00003712 [Ensete ventricosum]|nr:hypothetical protein BHE74_00003712 [Ensete ventricosum]
MYRSDRIQKKREKRKKEKRERYLLFPESPRKLSPVSDPWPAGFLLCSGRRAEKGEGNSPRGNEAMPHLPAQGEGERDPIVNHVGDGMPKRTARCIPLTPYRHTKFISVWYGTQY